MLGWACVGEWGCHEQTPFTQRLAPTCRGHGQQAASRGQLLSGGLSCRELLDLRPCLIGQPVWPLNGGRGGNKGPYIRQDVRPHCWAVLLPEPPLDWQRNCQPSTAVNISSHKLCLNIFFREPHLQQKCYIFPRSMSMYFASVSLWPLTQC